MALSRRSRQINATPFIANRENGFMSCRNPSGQNVIVQMRHPPHRHPRRT